MNDGAKEREKVRECGENIQRWVLRTKKVGARRRRGGKAEREKRGREIGKRESARRSRFLLLFGLPNKELPREPLKDMPKRGSSSLLLPTTPAPFPVARPPSTAQTLPVGPLPRPAASTHSRTDHLCLVCSAHTTNYRSCEPAAAVTTINFNLAYHVTVIRPSRRC